MTLIFTICCIYEQYDNTTYGKMQYKKDLLVENKSKYKLRFTNTAFYDIMNPGGLLCLSTLD